jgi:hypothetical protein
MRGITDVLVAELKEKHGEELDLKNHHYFLFYKDGLFEMYFDEDEETLKVDVTLLGDSTRIYHTEKSMEEELDIFTKEKPTDGNQ